MPARIIKPTPPTLFKWLNFPKKRLNLRALMELKTLSNSFQIFITVSVTILRCFYISPSKNFLFKNNFIKL